MTEYSFTKCQRAIYSSGLPGLDYALNPYIGCEHGCAYCYSPAVLRKEDYIRNWGNFVFIKENLPTLLEKEIAKIKPGCVGIGTVCDPYQPVEKRVEMTRKSLEILKDKKFGLCIQTKSDLVLRDVELLNEERDEVGLTITTLDNGLAKKIEPRASPPDARAQALEELSRLQIRRWLFLGPVIPGVNDFEESLSEVIGIAKKTGSLVIYDKLNLKRGVEERLSKALGNSDFLSLLTHEWWKETSRRIERICREQGVRCEPAFVHTFKQGFRNPKEREKGWSAGRKHLWQDF